MTEILFEAGHVGGAWAVGRSCKGCMGSWAHGLDRVALWQDRNTSFLPIVTVNLFSKKHSNLYFADTLGLHFAIKNKYVANTGSYRVNSSFVNVRR